MAALRFGPQTKGSLRHGLWTQYPYWILGFLTLLAPVTCSLTMLRLAVADGGTANVIAPYLLALGKSRNEVVTDQYTCQMGIYPRPTDTYCTTRLHATEPISRVALVLQNGVVRRVDITVRGSALRVGDLVLLFGTPVIQEPNRRVVTLLWAGKGVTAIAHGRSDGRFSYWLPLSSVSFSIPAAGERSHD